MYVSDSMLGRYSIAIMSLFLSARADNVPEAWEIIEWTATTYFAQGAVVERWV
jgi:hypothetical protein